MSRKIFKYKAGHVGHRTKVSMPRGSEIVAFGMQGDQFFLWAMVDPDPELEIQDRTVTVVGTGDEFPFDGVHRGTCFETLAAGRYVWHLIELPS